MLFVIFVSLILAFYTLFRFSRRNMYTAAESFHAPHSHPLFGQLWWGMGHAPIKLHELMIKEFGKHETPFKIHIGPLLAIFITKPEDAQAVLTSPHCINKPYVYKFLENERSLFTADAHIWKSDRKHLNRAFTMPVLKSFLPIFNEQSQQMVLRLEEHIGKPEFNIHEEFELYTIKTTLATTLGIDFNDFGEECLRKYLNNTKKITEMSFSRMLTLPFHLDFLYYNHPTGKKYQKLREFMYKVAKDVLDRKKAQKNSINLIGDGENDNQNDDVEFKTPQVFIEKLLEVPDFDEKAMLDHIDGMIVAGTETTSVTLANTILALAMHPNLQEKVYQEIMDVVLEKGRFIDYATIGKLEYMETVLKETMRVLPIVIVVGRNIEGDVQIGDKTIPKDSYVGIYTWYLQRDKKIWGPNADKYDPDHFLPENVKNRHPYSYLPFLSGPRNCIGSKYSWFSMKVNLTNMIKNYKFKTNLKWEDLKMKPAVVVKMEGDYLVTIKRRV